MDELARACEEWGLPAWFEELTRKCLAQRMTFEEFRTLVELEADLQAPQLPDA